MAKKFLMIMEGETEEVTFYKRLFQTCFRKGSYEIFSYRTNIHILAQVLYNNYPDFDQAECQIDIRLVLSSAEEDEDRKAVLKQNYTDIYLIFDFDPQHDHTHFDTVRRMLRFFNDPTDCGKLYINYPMLQSYKHFSSLPDSTFYSKKVNLEEIKTYKELVDRESGFRDLTQYDYKIFYSLAVHHLMKANYLLNHSYVIPSASTYQDFDMTKLYDCELKLFSELYMVFVLNSCIFVLCDFALNKFFQFINRHSSELYI